MANFYISDLHIGCKNKYESRTLETDQKLKENWNKAVTNADTVYILGDIGRCGTNKDNELLSQNFKGDCEIMEGNYILINPDTQRIVYAIIASAFIKVRAYRESDEMFMGDTVFNTYEEAVVRLRKMEEEEEENIDWEEEEENVE